MRTPLRGGCSAGKKVARRGQEAASGGGRLSDQRERSLNPAMPFSLTLPVPPPGAEGENTQTRRSRHPLKQTGQFRPPQRIGAKSSRNKQRRERSDPPTGDGSAIGMTAAKRRAWQSPVADLHQRAEGRRSRSRRDGSEADPVSTRPAKPGCPRDCRKERRTPPQECTAGHGCRLTDAV